jgi:hypothetical protein
MASLDEIKEEANELSIEELRELADFCETLANSIEEES